MTNAWWPAGRGRGGLLSGWLLRLSKDDAAEIQRVSVEERKTDDPRTGIDFAATRYDTQRVWIPFFMETRCIRRTYLRTTARDRPVLHHGIVFLAYT